MLWRWRFRGEDKILLSAVLKTHLHVSHFPPALSPSSSFLIPLSVMLMILPFGALRYPDSSQRILAGRNRVGGSRAASSLIFFFGSDLPVTSCKTIAHVPTDTPPHTQKHTHTQQEVNNQLTANTVRGRGKERATLSHFPPDSSENTGETMRGSENANGRPLPHP